MKRILTAIAVFGLVPSSAYAQAPGSDQWIHLLLAEECIVCEAVNIGLLNTHREPVPMLALDVASAVGGLKAEGPGPFSIIFLDTPENVITGNPETPFVLDSGASVVTDITFTGEQPLWNLSAAWGQVTAQGLVPTPIPFPTPPEPSSGLMASYGLGLLTLRRRRESR